MLYNIINHVLTAAVPTTPPDPGYWDKLIEQGKYSTESNNYGLLGKWAEDGFAWIGDKLLDLLEPFVNWGGRIIILSCFIIWYCSGEKKYIAAAIKWLIIFTLFWYIRSAVGQ
jgi:hypothetical protein